MSKVFPVDQLVDEAVKTAEKISSYSKIATAMCKEAVNAGQYTVAEGLDVSHHDKGNIKTAVFHHRVKAENLQFSFYNNVHIINQILDFYFHMQSLLFRIHVFGIKSDLTEI